MSAGQGTKRMLTAATVAVATLAAGTATAGAEGTPSAALAEQLDGNADSPTTFEVIVSEETTPGEAPIFEVVEADLGDIADLLADPSIGGVELNGEAELTWQPTDPDYPVQWEHINTGLEQAWDTSRGSGDIVIAVLDSGVAPSDDLSSRLLPGVSFVDGNPLVDPLGHGSSVAAVAAASHNQTKGAGVCPECTILPVQVATAAGAVPWSAAAEGIVWAVDQGADVINMSFSSAGNSQVMTDAIEYALAAGVTVVASAGNYGSTLPAYPAAVDGVISVGAHTASFERYPWSSHGEWVDVAAPGCALGAAGAAGGMVCGTRFAAPWTAGVVGLVLSVEESLTPNDVELHLENSAVALPWVEAGWIDAVSVLTDIPHPDSDSDSDPDPTEFGDVIAGSFYADAVAWMVAEGITTGTAPGEFSPEDSVTRGQLATFLWRADGQPVGDGAAFGDVIAGSFYADAVAWMVAEGITTGTAPDAFSPDEAVTRGQLATFLWRAEVEPVV